MHNATVSDPNKQATAAELGDALGELGQLPKSKTGRLLIRSALVGFLLVFAWIFAIVYLQWREHRRPDFRGLVETNLLQLRDHKYEQLYANSSPRFQELVRFETFADRMEELAEAVGRFREIASIDGTEMYRGPSGLTTYLRLRLIFEKGICQAAMSFHRTGLRWDITMRGGAVAKWFKTIREGTTARAIKPDGTEAIVQMPAFEQRLSREQTWLVVTYLQSFDRDLPKPGTAR